MGIRPYIYLSKLSKIMREKNVNPTIFFHQVESWNILKKKNHLYLAENMLL